MRLDATTVDSWWGSLGASLALHAVLLAGLLTALWGERRALPEAADLWQGDTVTVDTVSEGSGAGTPAAPSEPPVATPAVAEPAMNPTEPASEAPSEPATPSVPVVKHNATVKQIETLKHTETVKQPIVVPARPVAKAPPKPKPQQAAPRDPNEALLAKVMGFTPNSGSSHEEPRPASSAPQAGVAERSAPGMGSGGSQQPANVRNLPKAFTRALPYAVDGAAAQWNKLPLGKAEQSRVTVRVGASGEILDHSLPREASLRMKELARRTVALLGAGQFALRNTQVSAGAMTLQIEVWLSVEPDAKVGYSFKSPTPTQEGEAAYTSSTGWTFKAKVRELP